MNTQKRSLPSIADLDYVLNRVNPYWDELENNIILITGGTGIVGKWILATLDHARTSLGLDVEVVLLSRNPENFIRKKPELGDKEYITWIKGDIRSFSLPPGISPAFAIHAATDVVDQSSQWDVLTTCSIGTYNLATQLAVVECRRMLLLSSGAIYGKTPSAIKGIPESFVGSVSSTNPLSAYAEGKRYAELLCSLLAANHNMTIPIARCFAMVGPYLPLDKHFAIGNFIQSALNNRPIVIEGDGTPLRSYLYLADVISQLWLLLFKGRTTAYNVGSNEPISIRSLAEKVTSILGCEWPVIVEGKTMHGVHANEYYPDTSLINKELNIRKTISIEDAILRTAGWYAGNV